VAAAAPRRSASTVDFGGVKEVVYERSDFPKAAVQAEFKKDTLAMLGYGTQGRGQALNARDNGLSVIVGLREGGGSWALALKDGWVPGKTLFSVDEAARRGTIIMYLLSDAGQKSEWPQLKKHVTPGKTLMFAHGFSIVFKEQTGVVPPAGVDVVLVAPKGSGTTVRSLFLEGRGINASVGVHQDASGRAKERALKLGVAVGAGYMYETSFRNEVLSDLYGERGILMGAIQGAFAAQYDVLRAKGHSPSEAFNETVEEATQSLYPLIARNGMDWMFVAAAQRPSSRRAAVGAGGARPGSPRGRLLTQPSAPPSPRPSRAPSAPQVRQLLDHGAARRARLVAPLPRRHEARLREALRVGRDGRGDAPHARGQQPPHLQGRPREGARGARQLGDVARGQGRARAAAGEPQEGVGRPGGPGARGRISQRRRRRRRRRRQRRRRR
jgi:ketol-acid reductoisomerase